MPTYTCLIRLILHWVHGYIDLQFCRLETGKEEAVREKIERDQKKQAKKLKAKQDERDRKVYEKLKKKLKIVD